MFQPILHRFQSQDDYKSVDLSKSNLDSKNVDPQNQYELTAYLDKIKSYKQAKVLYGGYLEKRGLYDKKSLFNAADKQRNIHLGIDFWADAGEEIICPLKGSVHSFADNTGFGNYGPCIILKHQTNYVSFYSLYGHLSRESLLNIKVGQSINQNQVFCNLGDTNENGGYIPHLHFQLIKNIGEYFGDYPGVCHKEDLNFYKKNIISPIPFLGL
ncbi:peptidoglycan DD-metalloendopeptidase family protein [Mesohalobacter halotolerans]|uniref:peptidoglycan DD-metalloendopeptidase family protein n=1 Tax=Mesohalobacter halotolerans TaxID=1883405 RepID=UPI0014865064|nr:peptidoglycan DD-metalloendopeptidase family protein [Mesohalobacter halotolerans]MBS3738000.1 peptidoglycan DD-metalloendopeptidase family protein [Psychroflexus sp.]